MPDKNNRPIAEVRDGGLAIAIWRNEPTEEGGRVRYDHKFSHRYFNKTANEWRETDYSSGEQNLRIANLFVQAYNKELELRAEDREAGQNGPVPN